MSEKFTIAILENNIIVNEITHIEKGNVYNSIPAYIFQNDSWSILSKHDVDIRLDLMAERTTIGQNRQKLAFLVLSRCISEEICVPVSEQTNESIADNEPILINPFQQCLERAFNAMNNYCQMFVRKYIVNYNMKESK